MTKLYAEVYRSKTGAKHAAEVALSYGQADAASIWQARAGCYDHVLLLLKNPEVTPNWYKRLICNLFHQKYSLKCPNCGGQF